MPKRDNVHFDEYSLQTQAKHKILTDYLPAYLTALKNKVDGFHYIDAFAGRGKYAGEFLGSPLLALDIINDSGLSRITSVSMVEEKPEYLNALRLELQHHKATPRLFDEIFLESGKFSDHIGNILDRNIYDRGKVATFAFVDPCGVDGVKMSDLRRLLGQDFGELLLFFNYDGVNRLVGGALKNTHDTRILVELFGSNASVEKLLSTVKTISSTLEKEKIILNHFVSNLIKSSGATYILPFRFQAKTRNRTSHYIVHCCDNCLGFKIIKSVMRKTGTSTSEKLGSLEFLSKDETVGQTQLFSTETTEIKEKILTFLNEAPSKVSQITKAWVCRPNDIFSEGVYKTILLELENENKILVYDKNNIKITPSSERRHIKGSPTLGDDYWLKLNKVKD